MIALLTALLLAAPSLDTSQCNSTQYSGGTSGSSISTTIASIGNGDVVVVWVGSENIAGISVSSSNLTYTKRGSDELHGAGPGGLAMWTSVSGGSLSSEQITASNSDTSSRSTMICVEVWSSAGSGQLTNYTSAETAGTNPSSVSFTRNGSDSHVSAGFWYPIWNDAFTAGSNTTETAETQDNSRFKDIWAGRSTTSGTGSVTLNVTGGVGNQAGLWFVVEIEDSGGGGGGCTDHTMMGMRGCYP